MASTACRGSRRSRASNLRTRLLLDVGLIIFFGSSPKTVMGLKRL